MEHVIIKDTLDEGLYFYTENEWGETVALIDFYNLYIGEPQTDTMRVYVNKTGHFNNVVELNKTWYYD